MRSRCTSIAALLTVAAIAVSACGNSPDDDGANAETRIPISSLDYGTRTADVGNPRDLNELANLYATIQRRFQAGDMAGVCARVSPGMLAQFPPGPERTEGPCTRQLSTYARRLRQGPSRHPRLDIKWLRIYQNLNIGGITVTDDDGKTLRVPFQFEDDKWMLQLGVFARPDTLNGTLTQ